MTNHLCQLIDSIVIRHAPQSFTRSYLNHALVPQIHLPPVGPLRTRIESSVLIAFSFSSIFTARRYASAVYAVIVCLSVSLSVRPSATSRSSTKMAKPRITQRTSCDSPGTLGLWRQRSRRNSNGVNPNGGPKWRWGCLRSAISD